MNKVSVVIPVRNEKFLEKTVNDLLEKSTEKIQIVVVEDGPQKFQYKPKDARVKVVSFPEQVGMRKVINTGVELSTGKYILKADAHTMWDKAWDEKLKANCGKDWVVVPRRCRLDPEKWEVIEDGRPPVDYEYIMYPRKNFKSGLGLYGWRWDKRTEERTNIPEYMIDDRMTFQGSAWFMEKQYFYKLELMDQEKYGSFANEAQEISLKVWLSGGKVMTNKNVWYAHYHKDKRHPKLYSLQKEEVKKGADQTMKWLENKGWDKATMPFTSLIERFQPIPGWPSDEIE